MTVAHESSDGDTVTAKLLANHRRFLAFLESRVGSREDAEEILQNAFVRSLDKADTIRDSESAVAWFYRVLRNAVVDHYRRTGATQRNLQAFAENLPVPEAAADERVICECIRDLIPALKPEYGEIIARVDLDGVEVASVADALGISPGNARVRLHRARTALRQAVEKACRTCATHGCLDCNCGQRSQDPAVE
jgi:RNA polymerase sigma-70 factor (ECF subfamily)